MARFSDRNISDIKNKLTISEVVGSYVPLINKGGRMWAKCPFHGNGNERTPSFALNDREGFYHCFGCNESGDMFTFIEKMEKVDFNEAVMILARKAGVELEAVSGSIRKDKDEEVLYDLNKRLAGTFSYILKNSDEARGAREYLERRRVSQEMIDRFCLGYAPRNTEWLYSFLRNKGYSDDLLRKSGLFSQNHYPYPLFANRLMFPVRSWRGHFIAFSGRDLSFSDRAPKYVNSPDTIVYSKKANLFGLYEALDTLKKTKGPVILCEGNFDVVSMHQSGLTSAVASLGTAFTEDQCRLLSRYTDRLDLLFDSDEAGQKAAVKTISIAHSAGLECFVHRLESAKDSSELLEKKGEEEVTKEFEKSETAFGYLVQLYQKKYNTRTPRGKSDFLRSISGFLLSTESSVELDTYVQQLSLILSVPVETIRGDLVNLKSNAPLRMEDSRSTETVKSDNAFNPARVSVDLYAMLFLANHRDLFRIYRSRIGVTDLKDDDAVIVYMALENAMRNGFSSNELFLSLINDERIRNYVATSFELDEYSNGKVSALDEAVDRIALRGMEERRSLIAKQLTAFGDSLDQDQIDEALERVTELDKDISVLRNELFNRSIKEE